MINKMNIRFVLAVFAAILFMNVNALTPVQAEADGEELTNVITNVENNDFIKSEDEELKQDITVKGEFLLPAEATAGDYFTLKYPEALDIYFEKSDHITDENGNKLIDLTFDAENREILFEVLEPVNELGPLAGDFTLYMTVNRNVLQESGTYELEYLHGDGLFKNTAEINYEDSYKDSHIAKLPIKVEGDQITWAVLLNLQGELDRDDYYVEEHFTSADFDEITGDFIKQDITIYEATIHDSLGYDFKSSGQTINLNELDEITQYTDEFSLEKDKQYVYEVTTKMLPDLEYFYSASFLGNDNYGPGYVDNGGAYGYIDMTASTMRGNATELPTTNVELFKVNEEDEPLQDAQFQLVSDDNSDIVFKDVTDQDGLLEFAGLLDGQYTLTETKAPEGYQPLEQDITIEINEGDWSLVDNKEEELVSKDESQLKIINIAVDKNELENLINKADDLKADDYTTASFATVTTALEEANDVLNKDDATQEEVDTAEENLQEAIDNLVEIVELSKLVADADELDAKDYTGASFADLTAALHVAKDILANDEATQDEVNNAEENLQEAINNVVNIAELSKLVADADELDTKDYTGASFADLTAAVDEANGVLEKENVTQDEVDEATKKLQEAIDELVEAIDTGALASLIEKAESYDADDYTDDSFVNLTAALEEAKAVLGNEDTTQDAVDAAEEKLENAINNLVEATEPAPEVNKDALEALVTQADGLDADDYTDDSFTELTVALENAKQVLANEDATQEDVDTAAGNLQNAIDSIVGATEPDPEPEVDTSILETLIAQADNLNSSNYTDDSFANVTTTLEAAKDALADEDATQEDVDTAAGNLQNAIDSLVEVTKPDPEPEVDTNALDSLIAQADNLNASNYTDDSFANVTTALEAAKTVLADEDITQEEVDAAADNLQNAMNNLEEASEPSPEPELDTSALDSLITKANGYDASDYTEKSFLALNVALEEAKDVLADDDATQDNVDTAVANLQNAIDKLVKADEEKDPAPEPKPENVDKDDLNSLVDDVKGYDAEDYTEESYKDFTTALKDAKKVLENKDATQEEVDAALDTLQKAIDHLVEVETTTEDPSDAESDKKSKKDNNDVVAKTEDDGGSLLPSTATSTFNLMLAGLVALIAGIAGVFMYRRKLN